MNKATITGRLVAILFVLSVVFGVAACGGNAYSVSFNLGYEGATATVATQVVEAGGRATDPGVPAIREGYKFLGWFLNDDATEPFDFANTTINANITLTARWELRAVEPVTEYTVTFKHGVDGVADTTQTVEKGKKATTITPATNAGFTFKGWHTHEENESLFDFNTPITTDLVLFAHWEAIPVTETIDVTFNFNYPEGLTSPTAVVKTINKGTTVITVEVTTPPEGYTFNGWHTHEENVSLFNFSTTLNENTTLYAHWEAISITETIEVTFNFNYPEGLTSPTAVVKTINKGETVTTVDVTVEPTGYDFDGWHTHEENASLFNFSTTLNENTTLYAHWTVEGTQPVESYTVSYISSMDGATDMPNAETVEEGEFATEPSVPVLNGFEFRHWYVQGGDVDAPFNFDETAIEGNITLVASWSMIEGNAYIFTETSDGVSKLLPMTHNIDQANYDQYTLEATFADGWHKFILVFGYGRVDDWKQPDQVVRKPVGNWNTDNKDVWVEITGETIINIYANFTADNYELVIMNKGWNNDRYKEANPSAVEVTNQEGYYAYGNFTGDNKYLGAKLGDPDANGDRAIIITNLLKGDEVYIMHVNSEGERSYPLGANCYLVTENIASLTLYYNAYLNLLTDEPASTAPINSYIVGTFSEWQTSTEYQFKPLSGYRGFYVASATSTSSTGDWQELKVKEIDSFGVETWYGASDDNKGIVSPGNNIRIDHGTTITIYRYPDGGYSTNAPATVTYMVGTDTVKTEILESNVDTTTAPSDPTPATGSEFLYWAEQGKEEGEFPFASPVTGDVTLVAVFKPLEYTVTFLDEDGTTLDVQENITHGSAISATTQTIAEPTGYDFDYWAIGTTAGARFYFEDESQPTLVTDALTLVPVFKKEVYTITFNHNNDDTAPTTTQVPNVEYDTFIGEENIPTPTNGDKVFVGWSTVKDDGHTIVDFELDTINAVDHTFYAVWRDPDVVSYNVKFMANGTQHGTTHSIVEGETVAKPVDPSKTGYDFMGWKLKDNLDTEIVTFPYTVNAETEFEAVFKIKKYSIIVKDIDGTIIATLTKEHGEQLLASDLDAYLTSVTLNNGYKFKHWAVEGALGTAYADTTIESAFNIIAVEEIIKVTVNFNKNDGSSEKQTKEVDFGDTITSNSVAEPQRSGYNFVGWFDTSEATGGTQFNFTAIEPTSNVDCTVNYYARWEAKPGVTVSFVANIDGDVSGNLTAQNLLEGGKPTAVTPTHAHFTFSHWYVQGDTNQTAVDIANVAVIADVTYVAKWKLTNGTAYMYISNLAVSNPKISEEFYALSLEDGQYTAGITLNAGNYKMKLVVGNAGNGDWYYTSQDKVTIKPVGFISVTVPAKGTEGGDDILFTLGAQTSFTLYAKSLAEGYELIIVENGWVRDEYSAVNNGEKATESNVGYYAYGNFTADNKYTALQLTADDTYVGYLSVTINNLKAGDEIFVVNFKGEGQTAVYDINGTPIIVGADGSLTIYFDTFKNEVSALQPTASYEGAYIVGDFNGWLPFSNKFTDITDLNGYQSATLEANAGTEFKIIVVDNNASITWYGNNNGAIAMEGDFGVGYVSYGKFTVLGNSATVYLNTSTTTFAWSMFTVVFKANDAVYHSKTVIAGETVALPTQDPIKDNHQFKGWKLFNGTDLVGEYLTGAVTADADKTIVAVFEIDTYTITFDSKGGSAVGSLTIDYGSKVTKPSDPTLTGYNFMGWFYLATAGDEGTETAFAFNGDDGAVEVAKNYSLYAKWERKTFAVTFKLGGSEIDGSGLSKKFEEYVTSADLPTNVSGLQEYELVAGWQVNGEGTVYTDTINYQITADTVFVAVVDRVSFTVTFKNGTEAYGSPITVKYGDKISAWGGYADPTPEAGKAFGGWMINGTTEFVFGVTELNYLTDIEINAVYTDILYTVTFVLDEQGSYVHITVANRLYNSTIDSSEVTAPSNTVTHNFDGWYLAGGTTAFEFGENGTAITDNITVYAKWAVRYYTVTFKLNVDDATPTVISNLTYGSKIAVGEVIAPADTASHRFDKWVISTGGSGDFEFGENGTEVTDNLVVIAEWIINTYSVTFNANGGSPQPIAQTIDHGDKVEEPTNPSKAGHTFSHWKLSTESSDNIAVKYDFNSLVIAPFQLDAVYTVDTYVVTFMVDDENYEVGGYTAVPYNTTINKPAQPSNPDGQEDWTFDGWYITNAYVTKFVFGDGGTPIVGATTLYARFVAPTTVFYNVEFYVGDNKIDTQSIESEHKAEQPIIGAGLIPVGHEFSHWVDGEGTTVSLDTPVTGELTLTAVFKKVTFTVVFNDGTENVYTISNFEYGNTIAEGTVADPTPEAGKKFDGWKIAGSTAFVFDETEITAEKDATVTINAVYSSIMYTITFQYVGGTEISSIADALYGDAIIAPEVGTLTFDAGKEFKHWALTGSLETEFTIPATVSQSLVIVAVSKDIIYNVTFKLGESEIAGSAKIKTYNQYVTSTDLPDVSALLATGEELLGWKLSGATDEDLIDFTSGGYQITTDTVFVAVVGMVTFTVVFNDGTDTVYTINSFEYGDKVSAWDGYVDPTPVAGKKFDGWKIAGTTEFEFGVTEITAEKDATVTINAVYSNIVYTVSFINDFNEDAVDSQTITVDSLTVTAPTDLTDETFELWYWYRQGDGNEEAIDFTQDFDIAWADGNNNITLVAVWKLKNNIYLHIGGVFHIMTGEGAYSVEVTLEAGDYAIKAVQGTDSGSSWLTPWTNSPENGLINNGVKGVTQNSNGDVVFTLTKETLIRVVISGTIEPIVGTGYVQKFELTNVTWNTSIYSTGKEFEFTDVDEGNFSTYEGYYVVANFTGWALNTEAKLVTETGISGVYSFTYNGKAGDEYYFVRIYKNGDGAISSYPFNNVSASNFVVSEDGSYTLYFNCNDGRNKHGNTLQSVLHASEVGGFYLGVSDFDGFYYEELMFTPYDVNDPNKLSVDFGFFSGEYWIYNKNHNSYLKPNGWNIDGGNFVKTSGTTLYFNVLTSELSIDVPFDTEMYIAYEHDTSAVPDIAYSEELIGYYIAGEVSSINGQWYASIKNKLISLGNDRYRLINDGTLTGEFKFVCSFSQNGNMRYWFVDENGTVGNYTFDSSFVYLDVTIIGTVVSNPQYYTEQTVTLNANGLALEYAMVTYYLDGEGTTVDMVRGDENVFTATVVCKKGELPEVAFTVCKVGAEAVSARVNSALSYAISTIEDNTVNLS